MNSHLTYIANLFTSCTFFPEKNKYGRSEFVHKKDILILFLVAAFFSIFSSSWRTMRRNRIVAIILGNGSKCCPNFEYSLSLYIYTYICNNMYILDSHWFFYGVLMWTTPPIYADTEQWKWQKTKVERKKHILIAVCVCVCSEWQMVHSFWVQLDECSVRNNGVNRTSYPTRSCSASDEFTANNHSCSALRTRKRISRKKDRRRRHGIQSKTMLVFYIWY